MLCGKEAPAFLGLQVGVRAPNVYCHLHDSSQHCWKWTTCVNIHLFDLHVNLGFIFYIYEKAELR